MRRRKLLHNPGVTGESGSLTGLTLFGDWHKVVNRRRRYAEVVVEGETLTVQHLWPREAEGGHHGRATVPDTFAQRPARLDGLVQVIQAHGSEERAQELSGVRVALLLNQRDPRRSLLQNLVHGFVSEQVRETHLRVLYIVAQKEIGGYLLAVALFVEQFMLAKAV